MQGFETARYLGDEYPVKLRVSAMRRSQLVSAAIYLAYIALLAYAFPKDAVKLSDTAIIDMMQLVTPLLPPLLVAGALAAQFSAAVADTGGGGGLIEDLTRRVFKVRVGYLIIGVLGIGLTWVANVFQIIAYASRAFAAYYALQAAIASLRARRAGRPVLALGFAALAALGAAVTLFGAAAAA